jgi:hypothetical protein
MPFRNILVALLFVPSIALAAEAKNSVTSEKSAISVAQSACSQNIRFDTWSARETPDAWEVQGLSKDGKARAVVTVRKNPERPAACSIILEGYQSPYSRPL